MTVPRARWPFADTVSVYRPGCVGTGSLRRGGLPVPLLPPSLQVSRFASDETRTRSVRPARGVNLVLKSWT